MIDNDNTGMTTRIKTADDREIIIIGTAHVSRESAELVTRVIEEEKPDTVCIELCEPRFTAIKQSDRWKNMDIVKVVKEKKAFLLLANLMLAAFQKRIAEKLDVKPGQEMLAAIESAESQGAEIYLADREIRVTLSRAWRIMSLWDKLKVLFQLILSFGDIDDIDEQEIERLKQEDVLESLMKDVEEQLPGLKVILVDERDKYLAQKIKTAPGNKVVAVVGAGHVPGIKRHWEAEHDLEELNVIPDKKKSTQLLKWIIPLAVIALIISGFFFGGRDAGIKMFQYWVIINGVLAGIGAILALAHPITIIASFLAAPLTSLNPMIAAGWVSGLVEALIRKPKVSDFESLASDTLTVSGFWKNRVTKILLVVVFTNIGSAIGTFAAVPLMAKLIG